jgi:pimeloyl-ACP methyl ester carboxylesterase
VTVTSTQFERLDVAVQGGALATFRLSKGEPGAAPVLAIHGITGTSRAWLPIARALDARVSLVAVDLRGRGRSNELPAPYGMAAHAADALAVLDRLGIERAVVVGHSLGAYITARLAADHPDRIAAVVLVDGGLTIPAPSAVDPQVFVTAFLGPALARLRMTFASREAYRDWWRAHPALVASDVADADIVAYADHDLVGEEPQLRSSVAERAVRADAGELFEMGDAAHRLRVPATLLGAPRGLQDDPNPMQPPALAQPWVAEAPAQRSFVQIPDVNHYSITMGSHGAAAVAEAILAARVPA